MKYGDARAPPKYDFKLYTPWNIRQIGTLRYFQSIQENFTWAKSADSMVH